MTQARSTDVSKATDAIVEVDGWTDTISGLVEKHPGFFRWLGNMETTFARDRVADVPIDRPIYISGLARSGSTILLELLSRNAATATHRYRDFPVLHAPLAWNWFVNRAGSQADGPRERAHRDRIMITRDSPEAFEEVLWMAFFPNLHDVSRSMLLDRNTSNPSFDAFYSNHIRKLLELRQGSRYLTKANYNITRLGYIRRLFPKARFVVPIRDPIWHIASLAKQHRLMCKIGSANGKARRHLCRSGHFEFGLDRRPMNVGDGQAAEIVRCWEQGKEIEGWARSWASVYGCLLAALLKDRELLEATLVVRYETLCEDPSATVGRILHHCELTDKDVADHADRIISSPDYYDLPFDDEDIKIIRHHTRAVAEKFGY